MRDALLGVTGLPGRTIHPRGPDRMAEIARRSSRCWIFCSLDAGSPPRAGRSSLTWSHFRSNRRESGLKAMFSTGADSAQAVERHITSPPKFTEKAPHPLNFVNFARENGGNPRFPPGVSSPEMREFGPQPALTVDTACRRPPSASASCRSSGAAGPPPGPAAASCPPHRLRNCLRTIRRGCRPRRRGCGWRGGRGRSGRG